MGAVHQDRDFHFGCQPFEGVPVGDIVARICMMTVERLGRDYVCQIGDRIREVGPSAWMSGALPLLRESAWWIRNRRWSGRPEPEDEIARFLDVVGLSCAGGVDRDDLGALVSCMMARCVCDGCDLGNGVRFANAEGARSFSGPEALPASEPPLLFGKLFFRSPPS